MALLLTLCLLIALGALGAARIATSPLGTLLRFAFGSWAECCRTDRPLAS